MLNSLLTSRWIWRKEIKEKDIETALGESKKKENMTDEEMAEQVIMLNKMLGGEVEYIE